MRDLRAEVARHRADAAPGVNGVRVGIVKPRREGESPRDAAQDEGALVNEH